MRDTARTMQSQATAILHDCASCPTAHNSLVRVHCHEHPLQLLEVQGVGGGVRRVGHLQQTAQSIITVHSISMWGVGRGSSS